MGVIESEEAAKRLARVIVSDIEIYNKDKFHTGADLTAAIEEGRALFRSRVAPELVPVFTSVLEDRRASRKKAEASSPAAEPAAAPKRSAEPAPAQPAMAAPRAVEKVAAPEPVVYAAPPAVEAPAPVVVAPAREAVAPAPVAVAAAAAPVAATPAPAAAIAETPAPTAASTARSPARGGIIDTEEAAARLARVIISDIELYNAKKIAAGLDLAREIDEGRALFKSRVSGELLATFENALVNKGLVQRKRATTPAPVPKARPPVVETPAPAAVAPPPSRPAASAPMRPQVSAVNAPPAPQPRPGLAPAARPAGAPHAISDGPSARHQIAASAATPIPMSDRGSARHVAPPPGRVAPVLRMPDPMDENDMPTPMPGMHDDIAAEPIAATAHAAPRMSAPRMAATPPPVPVRASAPAMRAVSAAPSAPPARLRTPSVPEFPVHVESGPIHHDEPVAARPSQAVIDALPDSGPVAASPIVAPMPPPVAPPPVALEPPAQAAPAPQPAPAEKPARAPRQPTPPSLPASPPIAFAPVPAEGEEQVSLRRRVSPARVVLTLAALAGAGSAIWYFLLR
jgi:hypothetical protein